MNLFFVSRQSHALNLEMLLDLFCCTKYLFLVMKYNILVSTMTFLGLHITKIKSYYTLEGSICQVIHTQQLRSDFLSSKTQIKSLLE